MSIRIVLAAFATILALGLASPAPVLAETAPKADAAKPDAAKAPAKAAKPAPAAKDAKAEEDDAPSAFEQKKACDAKWKDEKAKTGAKGWKPYFTFMAQCM
jgi:hypothetical protein